ncbi:MAG: hypothetical protein U5N85_19370 [Arcicella sp.]|nr:hypothetical protein [Arcicella sp.]
MFPAVSPKKTSERKNELHKEAQAYKKTIDGQVNDLKTEATRIGTTALIVGAALAGVYVLFSFLTSESKAEKKIKVVENRNLPVVVKKDKSGDSWIISSIKGYIATFMLAFAKDKIMEAIAMLKENNDLKKT